MGEGLKVYKEFIPLAGGIWTWFKVQLLYTQRPKGDWNIILFGALSQSLCSGFLPTFFPANVVEALVLVIMHAMLQFKSILNIAF